MNEKRSVLHQNQLDFHKQQSVKENGYLLNGNFGFKTMMDQVFSGLWSEEITSAHVISFIHERLNETRQVQRVARFTAVDVGAGHNAFLRELKEIDPSISCVAIALGDPRTETEKSEDNQKNIQYAVEPAESTVNQLYNVDLIYCHGTLQHILQPLQLLKELYKSCALGAELYIEWDGKGQTSQVEWQNGSYEDYINELKARGIDIQTKKFVFTKLLRIKVNEKEYPDDFLVVAESIQSEYIPMVGPGISGVKSTVTLLPEKMKSFSQNGM